MYCFFFFFQAEDGIRAFHVTGVQTCALPISPPPRTGTLAAPARRSRRSDRGLGQQGRARGDPRRPHLRAGARRRRAQGAAERSARRAELEADLLSATRLRAQARYAAAAAALPGLITDLEVAAEANEGDDRNKALGLLALAYGLAVATLVRYNEHDLAWVAADRGIYAAEPTGDPIERALSAYRLAHAFVGAGRLIEAVYLVESALERAAVSRRDSADLRALCGALHLPLAVAQARKGDQARAQEALREAEGLSRGPDGRFQMAPDLQLATQFGPANVAAHQVSVAVDLGDAGQALVVAPRVDQAELSISRYSRHLIDVALAHNYRRDTPGMVTTLLDVEQLAPEQLSHFPLVREMLHAALRRERGPMNRHLHRLAERIGAF